MAKLHRQRVQIGLNGEGQPMVKWAQGATLDELNDNIVRIYVKHGLIQHFLAEEGVDTAPAQSTQSTPSIKFREYVERWMNTFKVTSLKKTTLQGYNAYLNKHLYPEFGESDLSGITVNEIQEYLNDRDHLARKTLREHLMLLKQIFDSAIEDGFITFNPASSKRLTNPSDKVTVRDALPLETIVRITHEISRLDDADRRLTALLLLTGMRRGEVLGLKWEDMDFEKKLIHVERNVTFAFNQPEITTTKTKNGVRDIPLDPQLAMLLHPHVGATGFIVGGGEPISLTTYRNMFRRIERKIDLQGATAHIFRHSYLTLLDEAGVSPKIIQAIAGHGDIKITMNRYVHEREKDIISAGGKLNSLLESAAEE